MQKIRGYRICTNRIKQHNVHLRASHIKKDNTKKFFSFLKRFGGFITLISIVVSGVKIYEYFTDSQKFNIENIIINHSNREYISRVLKENNITVGRNIFKVNLKNTTKFLLLNSNLTNVQIKRKLPDTIIVSAEDRLPFAYIGEKKLYQIDRDCIITLSETKNKDNIPVISGYEVSPEEIGKKTDNKNMLNAIKFLKDIDNYKSLVLKNVSLINLSNPESMEIGTSDGTLIMFGEGEFVKKIRRLEVLLDDMKAKGKKAISIDLRFRNEAAVRLQGRW